MTHEMYGNRVFLWLHGFVKKFHILKTGPSYANPKYQLFYREQIKDYRKPANNVEEGMENKHDTHTIQKEVHFLEIINI